MASRLRQFRSLKGPVILFVIVLVLVIALLVLWNVVLAIDYARIRALAARAAQREGAAFHSTFIALGSVLLVATISLISIIGAWLFNEIRYTRRLSTFIATFTHELNSPLASIKLFAQTLRQKSELSEAERDRFLDVILTDVERLRAQIQNVLRTAEVGSPHGLQLRPAPRELRGFLREYVEARQLRVAGVERRASLELADEDGLTAWVDLDEHAFRQVLDNLVDNALKYARPEGVSIQVAIAAGEGEDAVVVEVRDDGVGVAPEDLERIFERFSRVAVGKAPRRGTGLGLGIVRAIVEGHGGVVHARSEGRERGTTLRIELPRVPPPDPLDPEPPPAPTVTVPAAGHEPALREGRAEA